MKKILTITAAAAFPIVTTTCVPGAYAMRDRQAKAEQVHHAQAAQQRRADLCGQYGNAHEYKRPKGC